MGSPGSDMRDPSLGMGSQGGDVRDPRLGMGSQGGDMRDPRSSASNWQPFPFCAEQKEGRI